MNRAIAATAVLSLGAIVAAATIAPAMAAGHPAAAHPAAHAEAAHAKAAAARAGKARAKTAAARAKLTAQQAKGPNSLPIVNGSELDHGKYVTVVRCHGVDTPPPITLNRPGVPLRVGGTGPSAAILSMLAKPNPYKTIYTCTVVVKVKVPPKPKKVAKPKHVTVNTGFGGLAPRVADHHPAG